MVIPMARAKIAISLSDDVLDRLDRLVAAKVFPSRSRAIESAVSESLTRLGRGRLSREAAKLDRDAEQALAEEGLSQDRRAWPEY